MTTKEEQVKKISFPFGLYFKQLFAGDVEYRYINPWHFWYKYRINHLEICGELDAVRYLERCYQLK